MRNARLDELQARTKITKRNINNLRWYNPNGRKSREIKEPLDEGERGDHINVHLNFSPEVIL